MDYLDAILNGEPVKVEVGIDQRSAAIISGLILLSIIIGFAIGAIILKRV